MIRLIAAIDRKNGIAKNEGQPWHIPKDEQYFGHMTKKFGGRVLMGSTTYEVIGEPLEGRINYVLSRDKQGLKGVEVVENLEKFLEEQQDQDVWVIGGASVFAQVVGVADELYLTQIEADFNCDQFFPEYDKEFELTSQSQLQEENGFIFSYAVYEKVI